MEVPIQADGERHYGRHRSSAPNTILMPSHSLSPPLAGARHASLRSESSKSSSINFSSSPDSDVSYDSLSDFFPSSRRVHLPCYFIQTYTKPNQDFHGRQGCLDMLDDALLPKCSSPSLRSFALCGPGGIGKTQIAAHYYHTRKGRFDAVFWISGDSTDKLAIGFAKISVRLGLEKKADICDAVVSRELVKSWLEEPFEGAASLRKRIKWLLIIDGLNEPDFLHDYWPQASDGSILVTSRDPLLKTPLFSINTGIDLDALSPEEATSLLKDLLGLKTTQPLMEGTLLEIVQKLNRFPLAIVQMAGIILRRSLKPSHFLDIYNDEAERANLHSIRVGSQHNYSLTLSSTWAFETLSPGAACLLSIMSLLDGERIQEGIFTTSPERGHLSDLPISISSYSKELTQLLKTSLVFRNQDEEELTIHSIVQDVVRGKLMAKPDSFITSFIGAVNLLTTVWPYVSTPQFGYPAYDRVDRWEQCERILPHIFRLKQPFQLRTETEKVKCISSKLLWLLAEAAWCVTTRRGVHC